MIDFETVYVAGPMSGIEQFNFPTFDLARDLLIAAGKQVTSPADHDRQCFPNIEQVDGFAEGDIALFRLSCGFSFADAMAWDLAAVIDADAIVMLPGWENSTGAKNELHVALACGKPAFEIDLERAHLKEIYPLTEVSLAHSRTCRCDSCQVALPASNLDENVLEEADRLTSRDRNDSYGHPFDDFACTAALWTAWLRHKYGVIAFDIDFEPEDVAWMMSLLKHSREANRSKRDNAVDVCGYVRTVEMVQDERARRSAT